MSTEVSLTKFAGCEGDKKNFAAHSHKSKLNGNVIKIICSFSDIISIARLSCVGKLFQRSCADFYNLPSPQRFQWGMRDLDTWECVNLSSLTMKFGDRCEVTLEDQTLKVQSVMKPDSTTRCSTERFKLINIPRNNREHILQNMVTGEERRIPLPYYDYGRGLKMVMFEYDENHLLIASNDSNIYLYNLKSDNLVAISQGRVEKILKIENTVFVIQDLWYEDRVIAYTNLEKFDKEHDVRVVFKKLPAPQRTNAPSLGRTQEGIGVASNGKNLFVLHRVSELIEVGTKHETTQSHTEIICFDSHGNKLWDQKLEYQVCARLEGHIQYLPVPFPLPLYENDYLEKNFHDCMTFSSDQRHLLISAPDGRRYTSGIFNLSARILVQIKEKNKFVILNPFTLFGLNDVNTQELTLNDVSTGMCIRKFSGGIFSKLKDEGRVIRKIFQSPAKNGLIIEACKDEDHWSWNHDFNVHCDVYHLKDPAAKK